MHVLNAFKELFVISCGKEFQNFDAECEKERSYSAERDLEDMLHAERSGSVFTV